MHLAIERDVLDDLSAVGFEGGAEVVDVHTAEYGHEPVGGTRGNAAQDEVVAALRAPATNDVVALFEFGKEVGDFVGIVLQIAVHSKNEIPWGGSDPGSEGEGGHAAET